MTTKKSERKESKFQILKDAKEIRNTTVALVLRDFGIKDRTRKPDFYTKVYNMTDEDGKAFINLLEKYNLEGEITDKYPEWYIGFLRKNLLNSVEELVKNIQISNTYPTTLHECDIRREYHNKAIACCNDIYGWLDLAATTLPCDRNKFTQYFDLIEKEINSIKSLRKYDNKVRHNIAYKNQKYLEKQIAKALDHIAEEKDVVISQELIDSISAALRKSYLENPVK